MAEFHSVDGRTVAILQLVAPNPVHWAVFYDPLRGDARNDRPDGAITWVPVACFALVEGDAGHGPEQDVVALTTTEYGEVEVAQDRVDFAGLTADRKLLDDPYTAYWRHRWLGRTKADELMGALPPPTGDLDPFGDDGPGRPA